MILGWASGSLSSLREQPASLTHLAHDGPPVPGLLNWLRAPIDDLAAVPSRWAADGRWEALAFDEARLGEPGHEVASWQWRLQEYPHECYVASGRYPLVCLAWAAWQLDHPELVAALQTLEPYVDWFAVEAYVDGVDTERMRVRARDWLLASSEAGVWGKTIVLLNLSDRPDWWGSGQHYAVFRAGPDDAEGSGARFAVQGAYAEIVAWPGATAPAGYGYWSANYLTALSRATFSGILGSKS